MAGLVGTKAMKNGSCIETNMKSSEMFNSERKIRTGARASLIIFSLLAFLMFRHLELLEANRVMQSIAALLRDEARITNTYSLGKVLVDLERLRLIKRARLSQAESQQRELYSSFGRAGLRLAPEYKSEMNFLGVNGVKYRLEVYRDPNYFALIVEGAIYSICAVLFILIPRLIDWLLFESRSRLQRLRSEQKLLLDVAKRVQHDMASPITVFRTISKMMEHADANIKEVLDGAVSRTSQLVNDLNLNERSAGFSDIQECIRSSMREKELIWHGRVKFDVDCNISGSDEGVVRINEANLKRILSNVLNNAFESYFGCDSSQISNANHGGTLSVTFRCRKVDQLLRLEIHDNGPGFSATALKAIGSLKYSEGKASFLTSGSGIGLFSARKLLEDGGGGLELSNGARGGALVTLFLPV